MSKKILIVEDGFVEANNLRIILERAQFQVIDIVDSFNEAIRVLHRHTPDLVLLDIFLNGKKTGIDIAKVLKEKNIAFVYLSANSNAETLALAKITEPYGFLVKPFRERDILVTLDIANYLHEQKQKFLQTEKNPYKLTAVPKIEGIIGNSVGLQKVLKLIKIVAPTDTSVLILGESGTGKERIVDSIHASSLRSGKPLIKVNCAALPPNLIETELFGHERGAFTGASEQRIGKFELANTGTIFLDEIGEMPIDLQVKLLRVLQEKEIERIGGKGSFKVDVRVIAATNRDLEKEVSEGRFRIDLFYRLNVFPIPLPALRERPGDIPLLAAHFVRQFCKNNRVEEKNISEKVMEKLLAYPWPGNIRELEHLMERSVLLTAEKVIKQIDLPEADPRLLNSSSGRVKTIKQLEIDHIVSVLETCNGKLSGPGGAAEVLQMPYGTLIYKIKKLGIKTDKYFY
ncbi:MAG TPA: sigma-54 dependent transcriptional regulator [Mucilaginibacter sp.]|jgi:DNA-binding NtrC family response regulator